jgi:hypothetical protein
MSDPTPPSKSCPDCGVTKPLTEFPRNASRPDGHGLYCKTCYAIRYRRHRERKAAAAGRTIRERHVVPSGLKYCPHCKLVLPLDAFGSNRASGDGLTNYCRRCHNEIGRRNRERSGGSREYHLRRRYGIGQADVEAMIAEQGGLCAACRTDKPAHVDHDHETGQVRGMLCFLCNQALGNVRDDIARLEGLIRYLEGAQFKAIGLVVEDYEHTCCVIEVDSSRFHAA